MKKELLHLEDLTIEGKRRGAALLHLDLIIEAGSLVPLISAVHQKEILVEYLSGMGERCGGRILMDGREIAGNSRACFERQKIFVIAPDLAFMNTLSIGENIFLLRRNSLKKFLLRERAVLQQTRLLLERYGIALDPEAPAESLTRAQRLLIGSLRALSQGARLLVLYDWSSVFSKEEFLQLTYFLKRLREEEIAVLISDNNPTRFFSMADMLVIFKHNSIARKIYSRADFGLAEKIVLRGMEAPPERQRKSEGRNARVRVAFSAFRSKAASISLSLSEGELLLIPRAEAPIEEMYAQLTGSGGHPEIWIDERRIVWRSLSELVGARIALLSAEAPEEAVLQNLGAADNILLPVYPRISGPFSFYKKHAGYILKDDFLFGETERLSELETERDAWKLLFYRWKLLNPRLLVGYNLFTLADSRERIWMKERIFEMLARGTSVLLLETEIEFCAQFADRIWRREETE